MKLDTIYFDYILQKKKIYETRVFDEKRQKIKLLDIIEFSDRNSDRKFKTTVTELSYFPNFNDALSSIGIKKILPNASSLQRGIEIYENFDNGNYKENAKKYGVIRIKFNL